MKHFFCSFVLLATCTKEALGELFASLAAQEHASWELRCPLEQPMPSGLQDERLCAVESDALVRQASAEYVCFVAPGLRVGSRTLSDVQAFVQRDFPAEVIYTPGQCFSEESANHPPHPPMANDAKYLGRNVFRQLIVNPQSIHWHGVFFRKACFTKYGDLDTTAGSAVFWEYLLRLSAATTSIACVVTTPFTASGSALHPCSIDFSDRLRIVERYTRADFSDKLHGCEEELKSGLHSEMLTHMIPGRHLDLDFLCGKLLYRLEALKYVSHRASNAHHPEISVILPTRGASLFKLARSLDSLRAQSFKNFEVILVQNGGLTLRDWLRPYMQHLRIRHHYIPHELSPARARHIGLRMAQGQYISYLDDDNAFRPRHLDMLRLSLLHSGAQCAHSIAQVHIEKFTSETTSVQLAALDHVYPTNLAERRLTVAPCVALNTLLHSSALTAMRGYADIGENILDDWLHVLSLISRAPANILSGETTVDIYYEFGFKNAQFLRTGPSRYMFVYDTVCHYAPVTSPVDTQGRFEYKRRLEFFFKDWNAKTATLEGLTEFIYALTDMRRSEAPTAVTC